MGDRVWNMRMACVYQGPQNKVASMAVEQLGEDGVWKPLAIENGSPGFLIFVYSLFTCQHLYMFVNAAERGLILRESTGTLKLVASQEWKLSDLVVTFDAKLAAGSPTAADIADIEGRMNQCPVSRNIHCTGEHKSSLTLSAAP